jgi:hypothetical protein
VLSEIDLARLADTFAALADLDRRRAVLYDQLAEQLGGRRRAEPRAPDGPLGIQAFVRQLSSGSSALVAHTLADTSLAGRVLNRQALRAATGLSEDALRGATGDIGRKWARTFPGRPNPFVGRPVWGTRDHEYTIPLDLAEQLIEAFSRQG